jgi:hypothetical protein
MDTKNMIKTSSQMKKEMKRQQEQAFLQKTNHIEEEWVTIEIVRGNAGNSVVINDYRVTGLKIYGYGTVLHKFKAKKSNILKALEQ